VLDAAAKRRAWGAMIGATVTEGAALWWIFRDDSWSAVLHYTLTPPGNLASWFAGAVAVLVYCGYSARALPVVGRYAIAVSRWREAPVLKLFALPMAIVTGFLEEVFFRRYLMDLALHDGFGAALQIVISALAFGAVHGVWALIGGVRAGIGAMAATTVMGALLAAVYLLAGRSLLPCAASHIAISAILEPWLILSATSARWGRVAPPFADRGAA
jgi:membrane protease YdiL (CAAX protease family)